MKNWISRSALTLGLLSFAALLGAEEQRLTLPAESAVLKSGPGSELATAQCQLCHSSDYITTQPRLARQAWKAEVIKMQQKYGAPIVSNNVDVLVDYLTRNYGKEAAAPAPAAKP